MHVVSHAYKLFSRRWRTPYCSSALDQWYRLTKRAIWRNFSEVKQCFPATDKVGDKYVFDVAR